MDEDSPIGLTKSQLIDLAQPHCDASFTAPTDPTKFYTAWNSMKTLIQKDLVYEHGRPQRRYLLTDEGWEIAKKIGKTLPNSDQVFYFSSSALDYPILTGINSLKMSN